MTFGDHTDQKVIDRHEIDELRERFIRLIDEGNVDLVVDIVENTPLKSVRKAAARIAPVTGPEKLEAGREFILSLLAEKSNQKLMDSLDSLGAHLETVDGSIRKLDASSSKVGRWALVLAGVAVTFTIVQGVAAGIQIWKWMHGQ